MTVCLLSVTESPETEAAMDLGASEVMESEVLYDCVICGQSGPSTEDQPTGLVVLLQASSGIVLRFRFVRLSNVVLTVSFITHVPPAHLDVEASV